jgi:hypothetical protein
VASLLLDNFSGGLNLRDSPNELSLSPLETPDATNWTLDERGGLKWRKGCTLGVALPGASATEAFLFYSAMLNQWLCARESGGTLKLFTRPGDFSGVWTDRGTINSVVTAEAAFVDFPGATPKVVITTNVNSGAVKGIFTWDGTTLTDLAAGDAVCGNAIALWQNKVWVAGYPTSDANGNPTTLRWCDAGDPTTWTGTNIQQFREKDAEPLTGLGVAGGALVVFKKRSSYRVNDASTGAFTTIDVASGCVHPQSVVALRGRLYVWGTLSLYECDGIGPLLNVGGRVLPLFSVTEPGRGVVAGVKDDRVLFAYPNSAGGTNLDRVLEFSPDYGWIMRHRVVTTIPADARITSFARKGNSLYAAVKNADVIYAIFDATPGNDASAAYTDRNYRTPWLQPNSGMLARLQRVRVQGFVGQGTSTTLDVNVYKNWDRGSPDIYSLGTALRAGSAAIDSLFADIQALGHGTSFALELLPGGNPGDVAIRALHLIDATLQWPNPGYPHRPTISGRGGGQPPPLPPPD